MPDITVVESLNEFPRPYPRGKQEKEPAGKGRLPGAALSPFSRRMK